MSRTPYFLLSRILLNFETRSSDVIGDISAATFSPDGNLWIGSDEMLGVECLSPISNRTYGNHQRFLLKDYVELFNTDDEIDIEGMDYSDGYLWLTGSHSTKRKKVKGKKDAKDIERLATITTDLNRFILARIPVMDGKLVKSCSPVDGKKLTAAYVETTDERNILFKLLREDLHLKPFIEAGIPSKDNGLDIEGLIVSGNKLFLGLRGVPYCVVGQLSSNWKSNQVKQEYFLLKRLATKEKNTKNISSILMAWESESCVCVAKILFCWQVRTMNIEGEMQIFCWQNALENLDDLIHSQDNGDLVSLFGLPFTIGTDHAEGLALYSYLETDDSMMVFYDSPDEQRLRKDKQIFVDVFRL